MEGMIQESDALQMYFYVDESGDPTILGRKGRNLLAEGLVSKTFMVGYVETADPKAITNRLSTLRNEIATDEYLQGIPSLPGTLRSFHANEDCHEVKERIFKLLKQVDFKAYIIVARKDEALFRKKFGLDTGKLYEYLVAKLFENRLHRYKRIDLYFAAMGNTVREHTMRRALEEATERFKAKWGTECEARLRIFVQQPKHEPMLQVVDYALWTVNRVFERGDDRYYRFLREKIALVQDIFDFERYPNTSYTPENPLEGKKRDPQ
jgi:hypothetical protein